MPDGAESVLPAIWEAATDGLQQLAPAGGTVVVFDAKRAADEAGRAVEEEERTAAR